MQRLIHAVTALSVALYVVPPFTPVMAQETTSPAATDVVVPEGAFTVDLEGELVICLPNKAMECPEGAFCVVAKAEAGCLKKAKAKKAAEAQGMSEPATDDTAAGDAATTDQAAPAEPVAPDAAEAPASEPADQAVTDQPSDQTATEPAPAEEPAVEPMPAEEPAPAPDTQATDTEATDTQATTDQATEPAPAEPAPAETAPAEPAPDQTQAADAGASFEPRLLTLDGQEVWCLPRDRSVACPDGDGTICVRPKSEDRCEAAAQNKLKQLAAAAAEDQAALDAAKKAADEAAKAAEASGQPLIDAPKPEEQAVESLDTAIAAPATDPVAVEPPAAIAVTEGNDTPDAPPAPDAVVTEQKVTAEDTRASSEEFAAAPATTADGKKKTGLSDLEKVGLIALGALVVGDILAGDNQVVSNTGDRVVVKDPQGNYQVYKDDDVLLRQPGATVRTETFADGSTRTTVKRDDGTSVVTIRDASGRVIRRTAYDARGIETVLINDTIPEERVDVTRLPPPVVIQGGTDPELAARLAELEAQKAGMQFSLRQIRMIPEVKALAAPIPVDNVTFESGSAAIRPDQAENLAALGRAVNRMIAKNPNRIFLIEGHTDAVGGAPMNLTLSDRRAESVAKALTEYFGVPPENLVVQGYGERELLIDTQASERANRRVVVRDITPLLRQK